MRLIILDTLSCKKVQKQHKVAEPDDQVLINNKNYIPNTFCYKNCILTILQKNKQQKRGMRSRLDLCNVFINSRSERIDDSLPYNVTMFTMRIQHRYSSCKERNKKEKIITYNSVLSDRLSHVFLKL